MSRRGGEPFSWAGRRTLITGGSSGIGKHLAAELLGRGAWVGIVSDNEDKLVAAERELKQRSPNVWSQRCDISVLDDVRALAAACRRQFDAPDVIVNNAGYAVYRTFDQMSAEEVHRLVDVNFVGAALVTHALLPDMIRAGGGHVVMMASIAGRIPMTPCGMYSAAKHGLVAFARLLSIEAAQFNVQVNVVCPGRVDTEFFAHESFKSRGYRPEAERTIPIGAVSAAVIDAVQRNRFMTYVPAHYGMLAWLAAAAPLVFWPAWRRLLASRVASARVALPEDVSK